jgi:hypothetical protein
MTTLITIIKVCMCCGVAIIAIVMCAFVLGCVYLAFVDAKYPPSDQPPFDEDVEPSSEFGEEE